jgi:hypothetical protein
MRSEAEILPALAKLDSEPSHSRSIEGVFVHRMVDLMLTALRTHASSRVAMWFHWSPRHDTHE